MKRDMDLVRRIALATSDLPAGEVINEMEDIEATVFAQHVIWMEEAGLIKAFVQEYMTGEPATVEVLRLTWAGCEFADAVRDNTLWAKAKDKLIKPTGSFTFGLLTDWLKAEIQQGLPTLRNLG